MDVWNSVLHDERPRNRLGCDVMFSGIASLFYDAGRDYPDNGSCSSEASVQVYRTTGVTSQMTDTFIELQ
jgi:hypothetical protein